MYPSTIRECIQACTERHTQNELSNAARIGLFLAKWSTWEALRIRFIRVAIHHQGWLIKDADAVLAKARISSMKHAADVISRLGILHPGEWSGDSGATWKALAAIEPIRNKLTHGFRTTDPEKVRLATAITLAALQDQCWLESIMVPTSVKDAYLIEIGSILQPRISRRESHHSKLVADLFDHLEINPDIIETRNPSKKEL